MANSPEKNQKSVKILVVEDSPTQLEALRFILEEAGYSVVSATNGKEGLAAARANPIDLVISDIVMPEMDGYGLCKALRADETLNQLPVILLTSLVDPRDVIRGLESGANNFICKPYDAVGLLARVKNVLVNQEIRKTASSEMGINIYFSGQRFFITADRLQILDLLLSTYESAVRRNSELEQARDELRILNEQLEQRVAERTSALTAELAARKQAEQLSESLSRFPAENPFPVMRVELTGVLQYANSSAHSLLQHWGCEPGQSLPAQWVKLIVDAASTGKRFEVEVDCGDRCYALNFCPLQGVGYVNIYGHDITERKHAEKTLRESEFLLSESQRLGHVGSWFSDTKGPISWSDELYRLYGVSPDTFTPHVESLVSLIHPDDRSAMQEWIAACATEKIASELEFRVIMPDGQLRYFRGRGQSVRGVGNVPTHMAGTVHDITDRKRAEMEREKLEEQLRASQKIEAIGSLAGGVAHDFNNLLSVILTYTAFVFEGVRENEHLRDDLLEVKKAAERAVALTRQLLAFSRKQVLQPMPLDLNQIAAGVEKMLQRILGEHIELVHKFSPDLGVTLADPGQIEQVLMNLAVNARDAMPERGKLVIETSNVELNEEYAATHPGLIAGSYIQLAITDNGCGMDAQTKERLFEPFFTTKKRGKGTGLGLSTVYGIVKQSGGNIWVYSELGKGTTFKVNLPRSLVVTTPMTIRPLALPISSAGTETILVVEDEESLRRVARRTLVASGYTVLIGANGDEALRTGSQYEGIIHLLLTDVVMPRMSGRALAQALLKMRPAMKVLYMSGYTDDSIIHHGVLEAGTHFLSKPFTSDELARKIRVVLDSGAANVAREYEPAAMGDAETQEQLFGKDILGALPADVLAKLSRAVVAARYDQLIEIIETIRVTGADPV